MDNIKLLRSTLNVMVSKIYQNLPRIKFYKEDYSYFAENYSHLELDPCGGRSGTKNGDFPINE